MTKRRYRTPPARIFVLAGVMVIALAVNSWHRNFFSGLIGAASLLVLCAWGGIWFADPYRKGNDEDHEP